jgi:hypothetical protein
LSPTEEAILKTVIYADIFDFPLTRQELHHYVIAEAPVSRAQIDEALATSPFLDTALHLQDEYVISAGRQSIIALRAQREQASQRLWREAFNYGERLARLPFVRMVALTGALAVRNASDNDDDLDYVLVTVPGRVWIARACAILLVRLAQRRGVIVCPNYVLAESALLQEKQDLFMAHEVAQMVPIYGHSLYAAMRARNAWVSAYLPNATTPIDAETERSPGPGWRMLKRAAEFLLGGRVGDALEGWEYRRKLRRFSADLQTPNNAAQLDAEHVKGHFNDHGHPVVQQYNERLRQYNLDALHLAGD